MILQEGGGLFVVDSTALEAKDLPLLLHEEKLVCLHMNTKVDLLLLQGEKLIQVQDKEEEGLPSLQ